METWEVAMRARVTAVCYVEVEAENLAQAKEVAIIKAAANGDWEVRNAPTSDEIDVADVEQQW
jgi:hypothetical protein